MVSDQLNAQCSDIFKGLVIGKPPLKWEKIKNSYAELIFSSETTMSRYVGRIYVGYNGTVSFKKKSHFFTTSKYN